jgi:TolB-like protein/lipoprotein NlpI
MAALYSIAAWIILQVVEVVMDLAKLSEWIGTTTLWLLVVGFPMALIFSWFYELTPEGISLEKDIDPQASITQATGRRLDFIVISLLCAALILFAYDKWWRLGTASNSIAVLPFVNMSDDTGNEYFSDGITEELLHLLAKIPQLRVTSRTSAFSFKGQNLEIPEIARRLNVAYILEGSVRKSGNTIRITAQLIEVQSDVHLWSETWDRELADIFAIQDEIASVVVEQLKLKLLGEAPRARETNTEAYALQLQARHMARLSTEEGFKQSIALNLQALELDPTYIAAWVELANAYITQVNFGLLPPDKGFQLAREATNKAIDLDANFAPALINLGAIAVHDGDHAAAAKNYERALALEPSNGDFYGAAAILASDLGRLETAIEIFEYVVSRDPVSAPARLNLGVLHLNTGRLDEAIASFGKALKLSSEMMGAHYATSMAFLAKGQPKAALVEIQKETSEGWQLVGQPLVYRALGRTQDADAALAELIDKNGINWPYNIAYVYADRGEADQAFAWLGKAVNHKDTGLVEVANEPLFANLHDDPRWLPFLRSLGRAPEQLAAIEFEVKIPR